MQIYILIGEDRQGPFTPEELTERLEAGELDRDALAWRDGLDGWQSIGEVMPSPETAASQLEPPPLPAGPTPKIDDDSKSGDNRIDGDKLADFIKGYGPMLGRLGRSPKPDLLKWYDRFPVVFGALFLFWPLGILCVWLTKRIESADKLRLTVVGVALGLIFAVIGNVSDGVSPRVAANDTPSSVSAAPTTEALPTGVYITNSGYLAAVSKEAMDQAASYQIAEDMEALGALIDQGLVFRLKAGIKVQLMETHFFSGLVEIRPMGSSVQLWTNTEAISR